MKYAGCLILLFFNFAAHAETRVLSNGNTVTVVATDTDSYGRPDEWIRDDFTGNIWSPSTEGRAPNYVSKKLKWADAQAYCDVLNAASVLNIRNWHMPIEEKKAGNLERSEFLTAFGNPMAEQTRPGSGVNKYFREVYPQSSEGVWTASFNGSPHSPWPARPSVFIMGLGAGFLGSLNKNELSNYRCIGR